MPGLTPCMTRKRSNRKKGSLILPACLSKMLIRVICAVNPFLRIMMEVINIIQIQDVLYLKIGKMSIYSVKSAEHIDGQPPPKKQLCRYFVKTGVF